MINNLESMFSQGNLGFYNIAEVTEIVALKGDNAFNLLTVIVLEHRTITETENKYFLNSERIQVKGIRDLSFGVIRYTRSLDDLVRDLITLANENKWLASGDQLNIGELEEKSNFFVPADSVTSIPLNNILKNNFFNGSYVIEWYDHTKNGFEYLFDNPDLLQKLSDELGKYVPIKLASLSDRVGNIICQIPVNIINVCLRHVKEQPELTLNVTWHPDATKRKLRAILDEKYDSTITEVQCRDVSDEEIKFDLKRDKGPYDFRIVDENNQLLCAFDNLVYLKSMHFKSYVSNVEQRKFERTIDNAKQEIKVDLSEPAGTSIIGRESRRTKTDVRLYNAEKKDLSIRKEFVQYRSDDSSSVSRHENALDDIRYLINTHGEKAVWLWDPFLSADDIIGTLFYCKHVLSDMRAITSLSQYATLVPRDAYTDYKRTLESMDNADNCHRLKLEFRANRAGRGWPFHDRFLIFPFVKSGAIAWSLGTSVNSCGTSHHILQKVGDGQMIADAFEELWDALNHADNIIWKKS